MQGTKMPANVVKFIEGSSKFTIEETRGELRTWVVRDNLYMSREFLRGRGQVSSEMGQWTYWDEFIEDGKLVGVVEGFVMNNSKMELVFDCRDCRYRSGVYVESARGQYQDCKSNVGLQITEG